MNLFEHFRGEIGGIIETLVADEDLPRGLNLDKMSVEPPRDAAHGDITTNAAMILAKPAAMKPRDVAALISRRLEDLPDVETVEIAGPGFLNMRLKAAFWHARLGDILRAGRAYGDGTLGQGGKVNVEYVSANPTGPMHVGHSRGAVVGDALAALLEKAGYDVTREYYINDAGAQVDVLARSVHLRYREVFGEDIGAIPEGLYPGDYLIPVAEALKKRDGACWLDAPEEDWLAPLRTFAVAAMMDLIRADLDVLGVHHDVFTSERALVDAGKVDAAIAGLQQRGLIYEGVLTPPKGKLPDDWEEREQTLFKATRFGDDIDRPVRKSDGSWTYFASDMAYHMDKFARGFSRMINVWGADHGGYVKRMQSAVKALSEGKGDLDVKLCQMVNLMDGGQPVKMSKRAGNFVTLRELVERVGKDVVRFIMLTRKNDAPLDFDLAKVTEQSRDNPVFYVQYAHARAHSVMRHAADELGADAVNLDDLSAIDFTRLGDEAEVQLIRLLAGWPRLVESAAEAHEPHRVAYYLNDVAALFHALWNKGKDDASLRFVHADDLSLTRARLALLKAMADVIASGLNVFGVTPVEEMR
ncbi:arginine--tRNA ligase [Varunaivibrio sulfuroxidans]|uniref:Arginine--tRNA ligase n=1 Tax=Varunaivibrio sulfuroxidans TaxID=1773489 RepID=A0A4R3J664_9PROT|nr:arginine--tRNA ligase [Varunaivibrio sulfuroxidans]TCS61328.1 arginyl-tRNA synthetase [Varunaivibrio sulfuroxidans]WES31059.1 arginine--tRNA ligase [Varunaivibrio sulfuroxidans]